MLCFSIRNKLGWHSNNLFLYCYDHDGNTEGQLFTFVDDYSDKEHTELYQKYRKQFEPYFRIDYIRLKANSGPGIARKEGLSFGNSKYVTFIDADDVFATSTSLFTLYNVINSEDNSHINFCNSIFQEEVRNQNDEFVTYFDHTNDMTWMFGKIYRREFLEKFNINFNGSYLF